MTPLASKDQMRALSPWQSYRFQRLLLVNKSRCPLRSLRHSCRLPTTLPQQPLSRHRTYSSRVAHEEELWVGKEIKNRVEELGSAGIDLYRYPQLLNHESDSMSVLSRSCQSLRAGDTRIDGPAALHYGRVESVRIAGSSLFFANIARKNFKLQIVFNHAQLSEPDVTKDAFIAARKRLQRGDIVAVSGHPHRTEAGQLSLRATKLPRVLSPCLHQFPVVENGKNRTSQPHFLDKHINMLAHQEPTDIILRRSQILHTMREFLNSLGFVEVQTPILAPLAGGAIARPFKTTASESPQKKLSLRVAPELWLKRLVLGGMDRIFEIGASFRNEGVDKLHNPEFTTCEFYCAYTPYQHVLGLTERMLSYIVKKIEDLPIGKSDEPRGLYRWKLPPLALSARFFQGPYPRIDFVPALNLALGVKLPDLTNDSAVDDLVKIFNGKGIPLPSQVNLPRLLDKLSVIYLEPQCDEPTWIINHPECLSPLSKSFTHHSTDVAQPVAVRAELFIRGKEIVNCYDEENSPFEQRRKFMMQQKFSSVDGSEHSRTEAMELDEEYLRALEWGLPPTAGWGCGIDRLVMLLTGQQRINDVLPLGTLRSISRTPEARKMAKVQAPVLSKVAQNVDAEADVNIDAGKKPVSSKKGEPRGRKSRMPSPEIDAAEQAVIDVRENFRRKRSRDGEREGNDGNLTHEHRRLAAWLRRPGEPGTADRFLDP